MFGVEIVAAILGLGGIAVAYFIINFSLREKSYEEALAEQRGTKPDAIKVSKKEKPKKQKKKTTSTHSDGGTSDPGSPSQEHKSSLEPTKKADAPTNRRPTPKPEVSAAARDEAVTQKGLQNGSGAQVQDNLVAAPELPQKQKEKIKGGGKDVDKNQQEVSKEVKSAHTETKVRDAVQQSNESVVEENKSVLAEKSKVEAPKKNREVIHETRVRDAEKDVKSIEKTRSEVRTEKAAKPVINAVSKEAKKSESRNGPSSGLDYVEILSALKTTQLNDAETQNLLQLLIVKQSERHSEWVQLGKGKSLDPSTIAKRLMEDKERELVDEKELNRALADQLKDMKNLLNQEKSRARELTEAQRHAGDRIPALELEVKNLQSRTKQVHEKHAVELAQLNNRVQEAETRETAKVRHLEEESRKLEEKLQQHGRSSDNTDISRELQVVREERDQLQREIQAAHLKIQHLAAELQERSRIESDALLQAGNQSIAEEEKRTLEEEVRSLRQKTETYVRDADGDKQNLEQELHNLRQTTETQVREYSNLEESLKNVRTSVSEKDSHLQTLNKELEELRSRYNDLSLEKDNLDNTIQRLGEKHQNFHDSEVDSLRKRVVELESAVQETKSRAQQVADEKRREGFEEAQNHYEPQSAEMDRVHRELLRRLLPSVHIENSLGVGDWVKEFESKASGALLQNLNANNEVERLHRELEEQKKAHELAHSDAERCRKALQETEVKLGDLQRSIEAEEEKWVLVERNAKDYEDKCKHMENQLSEVSNEKNRAHQLLEERSSSVTELEHRLREAEERVKAFSSLEETLINLRNEADQMKEDLAATRRHKDELEGEAITLRDSLNEANRSHTEADDRMDSLLSELNELRVTSGESKDLREECNELRASLESEREAARSLAQEMLRTKGLIHSGLDALRKEEETVLRLQKALEARQHEFNGTDGGGDRLDLIGRNDVEDENQKPLKRRKKSTKQKLMKAFICS